MGKRPSIGAQDAKFRDRQDRAPARSRPQGRQGVESDGGTVKFRKIEIKPL